MLPCIVYYIILCISILPEAASTCIYSMATFITYVHSPEQLKQSFDAESLQAICYIYTAAAHHTHVQTVTDPPEEVC